MPFARINGCELYYEMAGRGQPCLVMHGGLGLDHSYLRPGLEGLEDSFKFVFYDHRGNGRSGASAPAAMLADLEADPASDEEFKESTRRLLPLYFKDYRPERHAAAFGEVIFRISGCCLPGEISAYNVSARLHNIEAPSLVMVGAEDFICPPSKAQLLYEGLADSTLVTFEGSGHFPFIEERADFQRELRAWARDNC